MNPLAAVAVKIVGGATAAAVLSMGVATGIADASTSSNPDHKADRRAVVAAVLESEADVLGIKPAELRKDLKAGQKVSDLAKAKGLSEQQFATKLDAALKPMLEQLVDHKQITQTRADRILDRIARGRIPFWNGVHHRA